MLLLIPVLANKQSSKLILPQPLFDDDDDEELGGVIPKTTGFAERA